MAHVLREIGWNAETLEGGYKAYRRFVVSQLQSLPYGLDFIVIHGPTGSGKSRLLGALRRADAQVLDLEHLAAHRGSVLGNLPDQPQPTQKMFESLLLQQLSSLQAEKPVYVEGESKKIGELQVPDALMERMRASPCIVLDTSIDVRVDLLLDEYRHFLSDREALNKQLDCLAALHGRGKIGEWKAIGDWRELVRRLLVEHYDPAYRRSSNRNFTQLADAAPLSVVGADDAAFALAARLLLDLTPVTA
jgi:tRNA 2-selenouridine synthase